MSSPEEKSAVIEKALAHVRDLFEGLPHTPEVQELQQRFTEHEAAMRRWVTDSPSVDDRSHMKAMLAELMFALAAVRRRHGVKTMPPPPVTSIPPAVK